MNQEKVKVNQLLNDTKQAKDKLTNLLKLEELLLANPQLLEEKFEQILDFHLERNLNIKKFIVSFIEKSCKLNPNCKFVIINKILVIQSSTETLLYFCNDDTPDLRKMIVSTTNILFKKVLHLL